MKNTLKSYKKKIKSYIPFSLKNPYKVDDELPITPEYLASIGLSVKSSLGDLILHLAITDSPYILWPTKKPRKLRKKA